MKGSLIQRGTTWYAVVDLPRGPDGRRRQRWRKLAATGKREAQKELSKLLAEIGSGAHVEPTRLTAAEYLEKWLADYAKPNVAAKTYERYEQIIRLHLAPALGSYPLAKLQPLHIQEYYSRALQSGRLDKRPGNLSPTTVLHHHRVLKEALGQAVKWQIIPRNPADAVEPPRPTRKEMRVFTPDQIGRLLEAARGTYLYIPILLAVATGARRGEILALRWRDADLDAGTISVCRSLQQTKAGLSFKEPKTARSRRVVVLPAFAVDILRRHRVEQAEQRLRVGPAWEDHDLVCCREDGRPIAPNSIHSAYETVLRKAGVPYVNLHALRHSHATMLLAQGVHPKIVSERLGHSQIAVTMDLYSHVSLPMQQEAAAKLDGLFRNAGNGHS
jgi:integrase